jgi:hypothetical protein
MRIWWGANEYDVDVYTDWTLPPFSKRPQGLCSHSQEPNRKGLKVCVHIHKNRIEKASRFYYSRPFTTWASNQSLESQSQHNYPGGIQQ